MDAHLVFVDQVGLRIIEGRSLDKALKSIEKKLAEMTKILDNVKRIQKKLKDIDKRIEHCELNNVQDLSQLARTLKEEIHKEVIETMKDEKKCFCGHNLGHDSTTTISIDGKCHAKTKSGNPCNNKAILNKPYCKLDSHKAQFES